MIGRGTIGQNVEAIVSSLPNRCSLLESVLASKELDLFVREAAALIYAMHEPKAAIGHLEKLRQEGSWYMGEMADYIREWGYYNPYA